MLNSSSRDRRDTDNGADIYLSLSRGGDGSFAAATQPARAASPGKTRLLEVELLDKEILFLLESAGFHGRNLCTQKGLQRTQRLRGETQKETSFTRRRENRSFNSEKASNKAP